MSTDPRIHPTHIRAFAEVFIRENKLPAKKIIAAIQSEFGVDIPAATIHWWRRAIGVKAPKSTSRKAPAGQTAASVDEGAAKRVAAMMGYMKPNNDGRRLGAPL